jgi:hypothetical protein
MSLLMNFKPTAGTLILVVLHILHWSTPVLLCARASPGFSGAAPSGPRSHLANTTTG